MGEQQRKLARHALGLPNEIKRSYRNRYVLTVPHPDWDDMVRAGYAKWVPSAEFRPGFYYLTRKGAEAALEAGENLDLEDFPA